MGRELRGRVDEVDLLVHIAQRHAHGRTGGGHVLEAGSGGQAGGGLELLDELPGVEGVEQVDVAGLAVEDSEWAGQTPSRMKIRDGFWLGLQPYFSSSSFISFRPPYHSDFC